MLHRLPGAEFRCNAALTSLDGLAVLTSVDGRLRVEDNGALARPLTGVTAQ